MGVLRTVRDGRKSNGTLCENDGTDEQRAFGSGTGEDIAP